jgi:hypothetical protein
MSDFVPDKMRTIQEFRHLYGQKAVDDLVRGWLQTWERDIADRDALQAERDALLNPPKFIPRNSDCDGRF